MGTRLIHIVMFEDMDDNMTVDGAYLTHNDAIKRKNELSLLLGEDVNVFIRLASLEKEGKND